MKAPLVTVAICTYNGEVYLEKMLNSVLTQDYPNFEVVIVDDGSSDGTVSMIKRFADRHDCIRPFFRSNHGLPGSRNFSFSQARGDWIAIIDQDDLCYPTRLSRQMEVTRAHPTAGLVFCNTHYINERDEIIGNHLARFSLPESFIPKGTASDLLLQLGCYIDSEACFIKRDTVRSIGAQDESLVYSCDYEYFIRAGLAVDFAYTSEILSAWRIHEEQATKKYRKVRYEARAVFRRYFKRKGVSLWTKAIIAKNMLKSYAGEILDDFRQRA